MTAKFLTLLAAAAAFWILVGLPARHLLGPETGGDLALFQAGIAVLICLVPALLTLAWASIAFAGDPRQATVAALGAGGLRMFGVLTVTLLLSQKVAVFEGAGFLLWVAGAYLFLLAVEVALLVGGLHAGTTTPHQPGT